MQSIYDFVKNHNVRMTCRHAATNPHMQDSRDMDHHRCTLTCGTHAGKKRRMTVTFSMGRSHHGKAPTVEDVLSTLAMGASYYENASDFASWASEFGVDMQYPAEVRRHRKIFDATKKETASLKKLVGSAYEELLYHTESL